MARVTVKAKKKDRKDGGDIASPADRYAAPIVAPTEFVPNGITAPRGPAIPSAEQLQMQALGLYGGLIPSGGARQATPPAAQPQMTPFQGAPLDLGGQRELYNAQMAAISGQYDPQERALADQMAMLNSQMAFLSRRPDPNASLYQRLALSQAQALYGTDVFGKDVDYGNLVMGGRGGGGSGGGKLTESQRKQLDSAASGMRLLDQHEQNLGANLPEGVSGFEEWWRDTRLLGKTAARGMPGQQAYEKAKQLEGTLSTMVARLHDSGNLAVKDIERAKGAIPLVTDTPSVRAEKYKVLRQMFSDAAEYAVGTASGEGKNVDPFIPFLQARRAPSGVINAPIGALVPVD